MSIPVPDRIARLPFDPIRGFHVPWFVSWIDGKPEFRLADFHKIQLAVDGKLCWVCGQRVGSHMAFLIGPMCAVNRISAEPPSHLECAEYSVRACPFLSRPKMERREGGLPEVEPAAQSGEMIARNPGVSLVWVTRSYQRVRDGRGGKLFSIGDPVSISAWREGRPATPAEIRESIDSGLPILRGMTRNDDEGALLDSSIEKAYVLLGVA